MSSFPNNMEYRVGMRYKDGETEGGNWGRGCAHLPKGMKGLLVVCEADETF